LTATIRKLSSLIERAAELDAPEHDLDSLLSALNTEIESRGLIEVGIDPSGSLDVNGSIIDDAPPLALGRILAHSGILDLVFTPGLERTHLLKFVQTIAGLGLIGPSPESDLVTFWADEGESSIRIARTSLLARHLLTDAPAELAESVVFEQVMRGAPPYGTDAAPLASAMLPALSPQDHVELEQYLGQMQRDSESSLRRQYVSSVLASLSCTQLALSPREYVAMLVRCFAEQVMAQEWEDLLRSLRNLEYMTIPDARVPASTRSAAKEILETLLPQALTLRLVKLVDALPESPPARVLRTIIGNHPPKLFQAVAARLQTHEIALLVKLFAICFAPEHPFWRDGVSELKPELASLVRNTLATADTYWQPSAPARPPTAAPQRIEATTVSLLDFSLDDVEDEYPNELDESLLAFLDSAVKPKNPGSALPSDILNRLDELENSLAPDSAEDKP
jgi:hypothetical protein